MSRDPRLAAYAPAVPTRLCGALAGRARRAMPAPAVCLNSVEAALRIRPGLVICFLGALLGSWRVSCSVSTEISPRSRNRTQKAPSRGEMKVRGATDGPLIPKSAGALRSYSAVGLRR